MKLSESAKLIYVFIESRGSEPVRLREVQRAMGFSSPSSALFHLQKMESAGLISKDPQGNYRIKTRVRISLTRNFIVAKGIFIPRHLIYAAAATIVSVLYLILLKDFLFSPIALVALVLNLASAVAFWYEAWQDMRTRPRFKDSSQ